MQNTKQKYYVFGKILQFWMNVILSMNANMYYVIMYEEYIYRSIIPA